MMNLTFHNMTAKEVAKKKYNTPEELAQAKRDTAQRFRDKYPEYVALQKKIWRENKLEK